MSGLVEYYNYLYEFRGLRVWCARSHVHHLLQGGFHAHPKLKLIR